jgi:hypothetical protein
LSRKNLYLDVDYDYDFELISIVSSYRDYRICWHINQELMIDLTRQEDIKIEFRSRKQSAWFNLYSYKDEINWLQYYVIANKSAGEVLVPELKEVDYFLQISGGNAANEKERVLEGLKRIHLIEAVFATDPAELKSKQNLVFE